MNKGKNSYKETHNPREDPDSVNHNRCTRLWFDGIQFLHAF